MALLVDSANALDGRAVVAAGYVGEIRYLSKFPAHVLRPAERDSNLEAGSDIVLCYEDQAYNQNVSDMVLGAQRGADNAYRAMKQAGDLGYPPGACIYFACDRPDPTYAQVKPYMDAVRPIITDSGWRVGFYGPMSPARGLLGDHTVDLAWVVETWTDYQPLDPFCLMQLVGPLAVVGGVQCDEDQILHADYGGWLPVTPPPPPAPPVVIDYPEDNMRLVKVQVSGTVNGAEHGTDQQGNGSTVIPGVTADQFIYAYPNTAGYLPLPHCTGAQDEGGNVKIIWNGPPLSPPFEAHIWVAE